MHNAGCAQTTPLQTDPAGRTKKDPGVKLCFRPLKERWGMGQERNRKTGPRHAQP